jgi:hypothetical protein
LHPLVVINVSILREVHIQDCKLHEDMQRLKDAANRSDMLLAQETALQLTI